MHKVNGAQLFFCATCSKIMIKRRGYVYLSLSFISEMNRLQNRDIVYNIF